MVNERQQRLLRSGSVFAALAVSAFLCARGATQMMAAAPLPVEDAAAAQGAFKQAAAPTSFSSWASPRELAMAVLSRNIFDSPTGAIAWDAPGVPAVQGPELMASPVEDPTGEPGVCQNAMRLVASFFVPAAPALSYVSIQAAGKTLLYRVGMTVEGHDIVGIREHSVLLRPSGQPLCQLTMFAPPPSAQPTPQAPPQQYTNADKTDTWTPDKNVIQGGVTESELAQGVTRVSDTQYQIARTFLDKVLSNQSELMRAARIVPHEEDGRVVGMKVHGVRRKSLLGSLGIQNGDVLRTINGFDLSSPDSALEAYTKLRSTDQFTIAVTRGGEPRNIDYSVR